MNTLKLTKSERVVLQAIIDNLELTIPEIGEKLHLSRHTVVVHLKNMYRRNGIQGKNAKLCLIVAYLKENRYAP